MKIIAVLGTGTMGAQIAYACVQHGYEIRLCDHASTAPTAAGNRHRRWAAQGISAEAARQAVLGRIGTSDSLETVVAGVDLFIDALPEDPPLKRRIFAQLDALGPPEVILASKSSSLRMSRTETEVQNRHRVSSGHVSIPRLCLHRLER